LFGLRIPYKHLCVDSSKRVDAMNYPHFRNKHLEQALFNPTDYCTWKNYLKKDYKKAPKKYILIYYTKLLRHFKRKYKPKKFKLYRLVTIYQHKDVGVVHMTGIGSPHAVTVFEELIALGGKEFLNIGSAGGLQSFGVFLCKKAIRDEGTSHHYAAHKKYAFPNKELTDRLENALLNNKVSFKKATSWTIDAPYRETKAEIQHYKKQNVAYFIEVKYRTVDKNDEFEIDNVKCYQDFWPGTILVIVKKDFPYLIFQEVGKLQVKPKYSVKEFSDRGTSYTKKQKYTLFELPSAI